MKIAAIKIEGQKPTEKQLEDITKALLKKFESLGFKTVISSLSGTSLKIGEGKCFSIDSAKRGKTFVSKDNRTITSYACNPAWDHRVEFNHAINEVLDGLKVSANVKAGEFIIRQGTQAYKYWGNEWDYNHNKDTYTEEKARELFPEYFAAREKPKKVKKAS